MNADINKPSAAETAGARSTAPELSLEGGTLPTGDSGRKFAQRVARNATAEGQVEATPRVPGYVTRRKLERTKHKTHRDPDSGEQCLVGAAPMFIGPEDRKHRWGAALVQHRVDTVDKPVRELKSRLAGIGWILLGTLTLLTMGIWGWLMWTIRREERLAHG